MWAVKDCFSGSCFRDIITTGTFTLVEFVIWQPVPLGRDIRAPTQAVRHYTSFDAPEKHLCIGFQFVLLFLPSGTRGFHFPHFQFDNIS